MMDTKTAVKRVLPRTAIDRVQRFRRNHLGLDIHQQVTPVILEHVGRYQFAARWCRGARVLDAACGNGFGSALVDAREYVGVDLDPRAVGEARRQYRRGGVSFTQQSVYRLELDAGRFDVVVSFETLEHVDTPAVALAEFRRVLTPGGTVVGSVPVNHPERVFHVRPYTGAEIVELVDATGFGSADWFVQDGPHVVGVDRADAVAAVDGTLLFAAS